MTELMNGAVIFKRAIHFPDRVESFAAVHLKAKCVINGYQIWPTSRVWNEQILLFFDSLHSNTRAGMAALRTV